MANSIKKKLIMSTKDLILNKGYENIKVELITQKAGVAKGSFYTYFKSKDDIFIELVKSMSEDLEKRFDEIEYKKDALKENIYILIYETYKTSIKDIIGFKLFSTVLKIPEIGTKISKSKRNFEKVKYKEISRIFEVSKMQIRDEVYNRKDIICFSIEKLIETYMIELVESYSRKKNLTFQENEIEIEKDIETITDIIYFAIKKN